MDDCSAECDLTLVFEKGGFVYVYESVEEAAGSIESIDVEIGHFLGAFSDRGEVLEMGAGELFATFVPTGRYDGDAFRTLIRRSRGPQDLADRPHAFATAILERDGFR